MQFLKEGLKLIELSENLALHAYKDVGGIFTIGWGHTKDVKEGDSCTESLATQWLMEDIQEAIRLTRHALQVTLNNNQFTALVSLTFNIGYGNLLKSNVLKLIHESKFYEAADAFLELDHDHKTGLEVAGLRNRRESERTLFLKPIQPVIIPAKKA